MDRALLVAVLSSRDAIKSGSSRIPVAPNRSLRKVVQTNDGVWRLKVEVE